MKVTFVSSNIEKEVDDVVSIDFVGDNGKFRILDNHDSLISLLAKGDFNYVTKNGKKVNFNVVSGLINVEKNNVKVVLTEYSGDIA